MSDTMGIIIPSHQSEILYELNHRLNIIRLGLPDAQLACLTFVSDLDHLFNQILSVCESFPLEQPFSLLATTAQRYSYLSYHQKRSEVHQKALKAKRQLRSASLRVLASSGASQKQRDLMDFSIQSLAHSLYELYEHSQIISAESTSLNPPKEVYERPT